jgi:two-component system, cell cycle sensor histidine kinase and response regulator CckA
VSVSELLDAFPDAVGEADLRSGNLTVVNRLFSILTGYGADDVAAGLPALELFDAESQARVRAKVQAEVDIPAGAEYVRTGRQEFVPVRARRKDGTWFSGEVHGAYILDDRKRPAGLRFVLRDIGDYGTLRRRLDASLARWEALRQISPVGIFHMARDGRFTEVNHRLSVITGMAEEELLGYGFLNAIHKEDMPGSAVVIQAALTDPNPEQLFVLECRMRAPGASATWVRAECVGERGESGEFDGFIGVVSDITDHKRERERDAAELAASEELLNMVFASTSAAIALVGEDGRIVRVNRAGTALTGYSEDEIVGMHLRDLAGPAMQPPGKGPILRMQAGETVERVLSRLKRKDGRLVVGEVNTAQLERPDGKQLTVLTFVDLTARLEAEARLAQTGRMESLGLFAGGIAHDFNNLLTVIKGCVGLARAGIESGFPIGEEIDQIDESAGRAAELVRNLLTFTRGGVVQPKVVDVNEAVRVVSSLLERVLGRQIEVSMSLDPGLCTVWMDPTELDQLLVNLAANARDAMPDGGTFVITTELVPGGVEDGERVVLTVTDTGSGMDEETRAHLFEPFFTTKTMGRGTGLGLATVYGVVQRAQGEITVKSAPGAGTTFTISLPRLLIEGPSP